MGLTWPYVVGGSAVGLQAEVPLRTAGAVTVFRHAVSVRIHRAGLRAADLPRDHGGRVWNNIMRLAHRKAQRLTAAAVHGWLIGRRAQHCGCMSCHGCSSVED